MASALKRKTKITQESIKLKNKTNDYENFTFLAFVVTMTAMAQSVATQMTAGCRWLSYFRCKIHNQGFFATTYDRSSALLKSSRDYRFGAVIALEVKHKF
jgi:hypothetical protein